MTPLKATEGGLIDATSIEVLICTHNRIELLKRTLFHLNKALKPEHLFVRVFVVANACTDSTTNFLAAYQRESLTNNQLPLEWVEEPSPGKSNALNTSIPILKGDVIAMVDDDHRVDSTFFIAIENALTQYSEADFYCGKILPDWTGSEPKWVHDTSKYKIYPLPVPQFDLGDHPLQVTADIAHPGGGNLVIKRYLFDRVGLFSNTLGPVGHNLEGAEDIQWVKRAYKAGAYLQYYPTVIQHHYVDDERITLNYILKKAYARSSSAVQVNEIGIRYFLFPRYLRKTLQYLFLFLFSTKNSARRFYLVRLAASLGEIKGFIISTPKKLERNES